ncbi:M20/M25/M40 family metallo-hydrolase [Streptomyces polychromogenes]|uniref:Vacuolar membrane protease n=1 Tax=Streptomyces polychromogenes TaxID=67342 RepID=A0ABN0V7Y2_9ACTN
MTAGQARQDDRPGQDDALQQEDRSGQDRPRKGAVPDAAVPQEGGPRWAWCVPLLLACAAVLAGWSAFATPQPAGADAPATAFSATRAHEHIARTAAQPHPSGSAAQEASQRYLVDRLTELGLDPVVTERTFATPTPYSSHLAGRVRNITATIHGSDSTGTVLLVAHSDSVPGGPGASDNGLGVASLLETARALKAAPQQRNDVVLLFTDSEETGQLGAKAFLADGKAPDPARTVVLNLDARGTSGRTVMFETGPHSGAVVPALADRPALATSLSREVYRLLPNETDFTAFREAGHPGLNFAVVGGSARYHTPQDTVANVDRGSLQDMGATVLETTRHLATADLGGLGEGGEDTYFEIAGLLVHYPQGAVLPLGLLAPAAAGAALWWTRRRGGLRTRAVARAAATLPVALAGTAAGGWACWQLALLVRPEYANFTYGAPYRTALPTAGLLLLTGAVAWLWAAWSGRRATAVESAAALTAWCALLAAVTAVLVPGASYLFCWPAVAGAAGIALSATRPAHSPWRAVAMGLCALPAVLLQVPLSLLLLATVGPAAAAAPLALLLLPLLTVPLTRGRRLAGRVPLVTGLATVLAAVGTIGAGAALDTPDPARPTPVGLMYALDADRQQAYWVTDQPAGDPWVDHYAAGSTPADLEDRFPSLYPVGGLRTGRAPAAAAVAAPTLRVEDPGSAGGDGGTRTVRLRLGAENAPADLLGLYVDTAGAEVESATVGDVRLGGEDNRTYTGTPWKWGLVLNAPGRDGVEVTLTVRAKGPVRVLLLAQSAALPAGSLDRPLPDTLTWSPTTSGAVATRVLTL